MEVSYDDYTAYVQPNEAPINDIPLYSKTASRRTVAKYLKRKSTISRVTLFIKNDAATSWVLSSSPKITISRTTVIWSVLRVRKVFQSWTSKIPWSITTFRTSTRTHSRRTSRIIIWSRITRCEIRRLHGLSLNIVVLGGQQLDFGYAQMRLGH